MKGIAVEVWHIKAESAVERAQSHADSFGLPQTVYRNEDTCGWANTNPFARVLDRSEILVTVLPLRYFS
jgi:hypothetical protein